MTENKTSKARRYLKYMVYILLFVIALYLTFQIIKYNFPKDVVSGKSGIFIDRESNLRGVQIKECHIDSIDEINLGENSGYWFGCEFENYSSPVLIRLYLPFELKIVSYGSCRNNITISSTGEKLGETTECFDFSARVTNSNILEIVYDKDVVPFEQIQISANLFKEETPEKYIFKAFAIKENSLPFTVNQPVILAHNKIDYSLKMKRDTFLVLLSESNFIPNVKNEITGDFNYERLQWNSNDVPTESILYITNVKEMRNKSIVNIFTTLFLGIILGILIGEVIRKFIA